MMIKLLFCIPSVVLVFILNFVISVIPYFILKCLFLGKLAAKWVSFNAVLTSRTVLFLVGAKTVITGDTDGLEKTLNKEVPVCYIANHTSILDIPAVIGPLGLSTGFIAKKELKAIPVLNLIAISLHSIFIDRKSLKNSSEAIKKGIENIKKGFPMLIFPEGTRSKTGVIAPFKHGSFKLATQSNAVIIPLVIKGTRDLCENRKKFFERKKISINVLSPIETSGLDRDGIFEMEQKLEKDVKDIYEQL